MSQNRSPQRHGDTGESMTSGLVETKLARLAVHVKAPVGRIGLRNPPLNVIDIPMMDELRAALADIEAHPEVSVIVLTGEGKAFSAGVDVAAHAPDKVEEMLFKFHTVIRALVASRKVTIAAVHGNCLGGGAELAAGTELDGLSERGKRRAERGVSGRVSRR